MVLDPAVGPANDFFIITVFTFGSKLGVRQERKTKSTTLAYFRFDPDIPAMSGDD
jgi:hypothetical protein